MIPADQPRKGSARLLTVAASGVIDDARRADLAASLRPNDLVVANDAATLPASLSGVHCPSDAPIEIRLAAWIERGDPTRFVAVAFGAGDHRTRTEDRPPPPPLRTGDRLALGPLAATVEAVLDHPRLIAVRFHGTDGVVVAGIARHGRPIQYAYVREPLELWDVWTKLAAAPIAFEPPSAGFALDWRFLSALRESGIRFATLTLAAGISSTGDPALDRRLPFDEPYRIPETTAAAISATKAAGGRIIAIGTTVVRALEDAALGDGEVRAGEAVATNRIGPASRLRIADAILTGVHVPGESHYELLRAFASDATLAAMSAALKAKTYRSHEFGDFVLLERARHRLSGRHAPSAPPPGKAYSLTTATIGP